MALSVIRLIRLDIDNVLTGNSLKGIMIHIDHVLVFYVFICVKLVFYLCLFVAFVMALSVIRLIRLYIDNLLTGNSLKGIMIHVDNVLVFYVFICLKLVSYLCLFVAFAIALSINSPYAFGY